MPTFDDLPYGGNELTCRNCNDKTFYMTFSRFRYEDHVKFVWGYQCQDCGELTKSEENVEDRPYLIERCKCGGQFRRDKPLFCRICKSNKTELNLSDDHIFFVRDNGEPNLIKHVSSPDRIGQHMTDEELHQFGVKLISGFFRSQGMIVQDINTVPGYEYPQFVMKSINDVVYYVTVKTGAYPTSGDSLYTKSYSEVIELSHKNNATPVFAGVSLANVLNQEGDFGKLLCGSLYAVSFSRLIEMA